MPDLVQPPPPYLIHIVDGAGLWMMPAPVFYGNLQLTLQRCAGAGIKHLVCLVEAHERQALGLDGLRAKCFESSMQIHDFPMVDRQPPLALEVFLKRSALVSQKLKSGESVGIHCKSGIGRSGMLTLAIMGQLGFDLDDALKVIEDRRGLKAPNTPVQLEWIRKNWNAISKGLDE